MDEPELWRWIWLGTAVVFVLGEMATAGAFFLLPFGIGAGLAAVLAFADVGLGIEWAAFVVASAVLFAAMRPLARRLDEGQTTGPGTGAGRLVGRTGVVEAAIPAGPGTTGVVRIEREEWRAESVSGVAIGEGDPIRVLRVEGTRLVVERAPD